MGYAGQPMKVVKANRALLNKRNTFKKVKKMYLDGVNSKTELQFKEVSEAKLNRIKSEIRSAAKRNAQIEIGITLACLFVFASLLYGLVFL